MFWPLIAFAAVVAVGVFAYLAGIAREQGRSGQEAGDLTEEAIGLRLGIAKLEQRCATQHNRIVAMTAWEMLPWPARTGAPSPPPVRPALAGYTDPSTLRPLPRPPRERRTSTAAFLNPAPPLEIDLDAGGVFAGFTEPLTDPWAEWPAIEQEIAEAKIFLAGLG